MDVSTPACSDGSVKPACHGVLAEGRATPMQGEQAQACGGGVTESCRSCSTVKLRLGYTAIV